MAKYFIQDTTLTNLADKIRVLNGTEDTMTATEMVDNVQTANSEVDTQSALIDQLSEILEGKAAGGSEVIETCDVEFVFHQAWGNTRVMYITPNGLQCYLIYQSDNCVTNEDGTCIYTFTLSNVVKGSYIILYDCNGMDFDTGWTINISGNIQHSITSWTAIAFNANGFGTVQMTYK